MGKVFGSRWNAREEFEVRWMKILPRATRERQKAEKALGSSTAECFSAFQSVANFPPVECVALVGSSFFCLLSSQSNCCHWALISVKFVNTRHISSAQCNESHQDLKAKQFATFAVRTTHENGSEDIGKCLPAVGLTISFQLAGRTAKVARETISRQQCTEVWWSSALSSLNEVNFAVWPLPKVRQLTLRD